MICWKGGQSSAFASEYRRVKRLRVGRGIPPAAFAPSRSRPSCSACWDRHRARQQAPSCSSAANARRCLSARCWFARYRQRERGRVRVSQSAGRLLIRHSIRRIRSVCRAQVARVGLIPEPVASRLLVAVYARPANGHFPRLGRRQHSVVRRSLGRTENASGARAVEHVMIVDKKQGVWYPSTTDSSPQRATCGVTSRRCTML